MTEVPLIERTWLEHRTWFTATKTKPIKAKHMQNIMADTSILAKFLFDTLEGTQMLKANSMICLGEGNDAWQQPQDKLLEKYDIIIIDDDGWMICNPKPENEVFCTGITDGDFRIKAQWGTRMQDGTYEQEGKDGDYVLHSKTDKEDFWIVRRSFFKSTYDIVLEPTDDKSILHKWISHGEEK